MTCPKCLQVHGRAEATFFSSPVWPLLPTQPPAGLSPLWPPFCFTILSLLSLSPPHAPWRGTSKREGSDSRQPFPMNVGLTTFLNTKRLKSVCVYTLIHFHDTKSILGPSDTHTHTQSQAPLRETCALHRSPVQMALSTTSSHRTPRLASALGVPQTSLTG